MSDSLKTTQTATENGDGFEAVLGAGRGINFGDGKSVLTVFDANWRRDSGAGAGAAIVVAPSEKGALRQLHHEMELMNEPIPDFIDFTEVCKAQLGTTPTVWMQVYGNE